MSLNKNQRIYSTSVPACNARAQRPRTASSVRAAAAAAAKKEEEEEEEEEEPPLLEVDDSTVSSGGGRYVKLERATGPRCRS